MCIFFLFCCKNELNSDVPRLTTHQLNLPKVENSTDLLFARKSLNFARFTGPKQTSCFAAIVT